MSKPRIASTWLTGGAALGLLLGVASQASQGAEPEVVDLTQTACQFVEAENGVDHGFTSTAKADCATINVETGADRLAAAEVLKLAPGSYTFRVTNQNVPYELGFWLRAADYQPGNPLHKLTKVSVSGGGLGTGQTKDYAVELEPGEYVYSCPLNPTPNYRIVVEG